jgi:uncharacterized protein YbaP (TraB family)
MRLTHFLRALGAAVLSVTGFAATAECVGQNLIDALPDADRAALHAAADAVPYPRGNIWQATRGGQKLWLVGTYHLDDPRHAAKMARIEGLIDQAGTVLVEAGPEEEAALMAHLARDPSVMVNTDGPTLPEVLTEAEWQALSDAMRARDIPPFMTSKFRPWYVSMLLAIPTCQSGMLEQAKGLDGMVIDAALERGLAVRALEPYDTLFAIFDGMSQDDQLGMIRSSLAFEAQAEDYAITLADAYFDGEGRLIWEFSRMMALQIPGYTPERVDQDFARMEEAINTRRNLAWIPVIEGAAAEGPVLAAFGALHLSGELGVLNLLEQGGWQLERLDG